MRHSSVLVCPTQCLYRGRMIDEKTSFCKRWDIKVFRRDRGHAFRKCGKCVVETHSQDDSLTANQDDCAELLISYAQYGKLVTRLTGMIRSANLTIDYIYGPPRGGMPIAVHLSHHLVVPLLTDVPTVRAPRSTILIVDDVADTGITFQNLTKWVSKPNTSVVSATLFYKPTCKFTPTFYVEQTDRWIRFPWERDNETPNR